MKKSILVIGLGNVLLKDEGAGIQIIQRINTSVRKTLLKDPGAGFKWPDAEFTTGGTSGLDILEWFEGRDKVIIVDAAQTNDPPGTLYRLNEHDLKKFMPGERLSMHNINLRDVLNLELFLHGTIPEIIIIAVNVKDITPGENLSKEVENKIPEIIALILKECSKRNSEHH